MDIIDHSPRAIKALTRFAKFLEFNPQNWGLNLVSGPWFWISVLYFSYPVNG